MKHDQNSSIDVESIKLLNEPISIKMAESLLENGFINETAHNICT